MRFPLVVALSICAVQSLAWIDAGHMAVAAVAEADLSPRARAEIDRLLKIGGTEATCTFVTAACWADDTKSRENAAWHYINHHFRTDGKPVENKPLGENVVWAIDRFEKILKDRSKSDLARADALRYLIHFVGDVHQPLHTSAHDSDRFPRGDRGGNDFRVQAPPGLFPVPRNLHFLWDMAGGLYSEFPRPLAVASSKALQNTADEVRKAHPRPSFANLSSQDPNDWALEGLKLCRDVVYRLPENSVPSSEYLKTVKSVSRRQIALAGYRLADLLNRALD